MVRKPTLSGSGNIKKIKFMLPGTHVLNALFVFFDVFP